MFFRGDGPDGEIGYGSGRGDFLIIFFDCFVETKLPEGPKWDEEAAVDSPTADSRHGP